MKNKLSESSIVDGSLWDQFCNDLKECGRHLHRPEAPRDAFSQAEGMRCLTRLLRAGLQSFVEYSDTDFPVLNTMCHETIKIIADNPDIHYQSCGLNSKHEYKIFGTRNTVDYISFGTHRGDYGKSRRMESTGFIDSPSLEIDENGYFEIIVSKQKQSGNWLRMTDETNKIIIRQTYKDRKRETVADLNIERLDLNGTPEPLDPLKFAKRLLDSVQFVDGTTELLSQWAESTKAFPNQLPSADQKFCQATGGDPNFHYYHGYWKLKENQALVLEPQRIPDCQSWNFQLDNYWMESLDYRYLPVHVNKHTAQYDAEGRVQLIISAKDPGFGNWIDTAGHHEGTMCFRWVKSKEFPKINAMLLNFEDLVPSNIHFT